LDRAVDWVEIVGVVSGPNKAGRVDFECVGAVAVVVARRGPEKGHMEQGIRVEVEKRMKRKAASVGQTVVDMVIVKREHIHHNLIVDVEVRLWKYPYNNSRFGLKA
jgi:hypothetical protein